MLSALSPVLAHEDDLEPLDPIVAERLVVESLSTEDVVLDGEGRYSVRVREADIRDVLLAVGRESPYNIVVSPRAEAKVTVELENTSLEKLLNAILKDTDLTYHLEDDILWIQPRDMHIEVFALNYIITERTGSRSISGAGLSSSSSTTSSGTSSGVGGSVSDTVTGDDHMDVWEDLEETLERLVALDDQDRGREGGRTIIDPRYDEREREAEGIADDNTYGRGRVYVNRSTGLITVIAYRDRIREIKKYLDKVHETLFRQVTIEVKLVEVTLEKDRELGIDWDFVFDDIQVSVGERTGDHVLEAIFSQGDLTAVLRALTERNQVSVKTSPRVTTLNNQPAMIVLGEEEVFFEIVKEVNQETGETTNQTATPKSVTVGVSLSVVPNIDKKGVITLNIHPLVTEKIGEEVGPDGERVPELTVREVDTVARIRDGNTLMLAGLTLERKGYTHTGVPYVSGIPILGRLFTTERYDKRKVELIIFVTPRLVKP